jgi:uncharacterized repeat protein (TIGR01451 family)
MREVISGAFWSDCTDYFLKLNVLKFLTDTKHKVYTEMKRNLLLGLSLLGIVSAVPVLSSTPVLANLQQTGSAIVKNILQPKVQLTLGAEKKVTTTDAQGKKLVVWQPLKGSVSVQPSDVLRYTVSSENAGDKPAKNLVVTQPIPQRTAYILASAQANGAALTFSIDAGKTFVDKPMVKVKLADGKEALRPAPAEAYTHIRWNYSDSVKPASAVRSVYEVAVK